MSPADGGPSRMNFWYHLLLSLSFSAQSHLLSSWSTCRG